MQDATSSCATQGDVLSQAMMSADWPVRCTLLPANVLSAFRKSGVHPFNPDVIDQTLLAPSTTFVRPLSLSEPVPPQHVPSTKTEQFFFNKGGKILNTASTTKVR